VWSIYIYILVSWWLIINLFTRGKSNTITSVTQYTQLYTIYTNIHKYIQIYTILCTYILNSSSQNNNNSQYDRYINTTCPVRQLEPADSSSSRRNIAAPNAYENIARNSTRSVLLSIVVMFTRILCTVKSVIFTQLTTKSDNIQFTRASIQLREFIELCPYANVCTPSSRM